MMRQRPVPTHVPQQRVQEEGDIDDKLKLLLKTRDYQNNVMKTLNNKVKGEQDAARQQGHMIDDWFHEGSWIRQHSEQVVHHQNVQWSGRQRFLQDLQAVEDHLLADKIYKRDPLLCKVCRNETQSKPLGRGDFVDKTNRVVWPDSYRHYLEEHNCVPSNQFFQYISTLSNHFRSRKYQ